MNQSVSIEVQNPRNFALLTNSEVGIFETINDLYVALVNRKGLLCNVYALEDLNVLTCLVRQYYPSYFYTNNTCPQSPLQLPATNSFYALHSPETLTDSSTVNNTAPIPIQSNIATTNHGHWAISGLNGFCVCNSLEQLVTAIADPSFLVAPRAQYCGDDLGIAYIEASNDYISRFYLHYDSRYESISLPSIANPLHSPVYIDSAFQAREKRWNEQNTFSELSVLYKLGL